MYRQLVDVRTCTTVALNAKVGVFQLKTHTSFQRIVQRRIGLCRIVLTSHINLVYLRHVCVPDVVALVKPSAGGDKQFDAGLNHIFGRDLQASYNKRVSAPDLTIMTLVIVIIGEIPV